jgi:hypothetical protein
VAQPGAEVATVTATWGGARHVTTVVTASGASLVARPGQLVSSTARLGRVAAGTRPSGRVGVAYYWLGTQLQAVPLHLATPVAEPSWWWRVVHG